MLLRMSSFYIKFQRFRNFAQKAKISLKIEDFSIRSFVFGGFCLYLIDYLGLFLTRENTIPLVLLSNIIVFHSEEKT